MPANVRQVSRKTAYSARIELICFHSYIFIDFLYSRQFYAEHKARKAAASKLSAVMGSLPMQTPSYPLMFIIISQNFFWTRY